MICLRESVEIFKHLFEFFECYITVFVNIILIENLLKFLLVDLMAELTHRTDYILGCYLTLFVSIELVEDGKQSVLSKNALDLNRRREKLWVIYHSIAPVVNFINDFLEFFFINFNACLIKRIPQLCDRYIACLVPVKPHE